jgi:hypothetical protein
MKKTFILLIILLVGMLPTLMAADADSVTLADLRASVRNLLGGTTISAFWTNTMLDDFINASCRDYACISSIGIGNEDTIVTAGTTTDYGLPSDFIEKTGVVRIENGRKKTLNNRGIDPVSPAELGLGADNASSSNDHPRFYTILSSDSGYFIRLDPVQGPDSSSGDTILVDYKKYASSLDTATSVTNVPYQGINYIISRTFWCCCVAGRDQPGIALITPIAQKDYDEARASVLNRFSPKYDPNWKPAQ